MVDSPPIAQTPSNSVFAELAEYMRGISEMACDTASNSGGIPQIVRHADMLTAVYSHLKSIVDHPMLRVRFYHKTDVIVDVNELTQRVGAVEMVYSPVGVPSDRPSVALRELVRLQKIKDTWEAIPIGSKCPTFGAAREAWIAAEKSYFEDYEPNIRNAWLAAISAGED